MSIPKRPALLVAATLAAATLGSPAFAATTTLHHTSLNARATKGTVAPAHKDRVVLTLRSGKKMIGGEESNFLVRMRKGSSTTTKWSTWAPVSAVAGTKTGTYRITVTMPPAAKKGQKEQYQVKFAGDSAQHYAASRSQVFVVKAS